MNKYISLIVVFSLIFSSCQKEEILITPKTVINNPLLSATDFAVNDAFMQHQQNLNTVGVSIGVYKNGIANFYGYGETILGNGVAPDDNTTFPVK